MSLQARRSYGVCAEFTSHSLPHDITAGVYHGPLLSDVRGHTQLPRPGLEGSRRSQTLEAHPRAVDASGPPQDAPSLASHRLHCMKAGFRAAGAGGEGYRPGRRLSMYYTQCGRAQRPGGSATVPCRPRASHAPVSHLGYPSCL
jgi:hypothetical protein